MNLPKFESTEYIYRGRILDLSVSRGVTGAGIPIAVEVIHHPGGAGALPLFDDGTVMLVRQYRYAIKRFSLEIPAGRIEPGHSPKDTAERELEEETGLKAANMELLSACYPTPGYCEEKLFVFLATGLTSTVQNLEADEEIELVRLPFAAAQSLVSAGEIDDAKTIIALLLAARMLK